MRSEDYLPLGVVEDCGEPSSFKVHHTYPQPPFVNTHLPQKSCETQELNGVDSNADKAMVASAGTLTSFSDVDVASTAFSPLYIFDTPASEAYKKSKYRARAVMLLMRVDDGTMDY